MKTATVTLKSVSPYSQSKYYCVDKLEKESHADYESRTWRNRLHVDEDGMVFIPPMALKNCMAEAAKYLSIHIQGKGNATYTKHMEAGLLITEPALLGIHIDSVKSETLFVPADGKRGGGKRVMKHFPIIQKWETTATFYVLDETITKDVFLQHIEEAGKFIGLGRFRPRNNGFYGRFEVKKFVWK